jgi:hypothetical protein
MKPLIVTNIAGEKRRLNPLAVVGWSGQNVELADGRVGIGTVLAMAAGGPVAILESEAQFDWLFEQATGVRFTPEDLATFREAFVALIDETP